MDTESYDCGIRFLAPYLVVWGYVGIYRRKEYVGGATGGATRVKGAPGGVGAPSYLVGLLLLHRRTPSSYIYLRTPKLPDTEPKP